MIDVNVKGLVDTGILDLDDVIDESEWDRETDTLCSYTACVYGRDGDEPGTVDIWIQSAEAYGIVAYRWVADDGAVAEYGPTVLDREEAVSEARKHAAEKDEEPDTDDLIQQIVETGYFGEAVTATDLEGLCRTACTYHQGYLLLPAGEVPKWPQWVAGQSEYLERPYVRIRAYYDRPSFAADAILRAIGEQQEGGEQ
ncbi:MAG: hypothetical protein AB7V46_16700 [Thermomicrobiales bacterium]